MGERRTRQFGVAVLVVSLVLAGTALVGGSVAGATDGTESTTVQVDSATGAAESMAPTVGAGAGAGVAGQQDGQVACNYAELYNETIDAVVQVRLEQGLGSGFVVRTAEGNDTSYVVTNQHVVEGAGDVVVAFNRGELRTARVVGTDALSDLAVVRVNDTPGYVESLNLMETQPVPGEWVAALGSPFGLAGTITQGIVSGVNRSMPTDAGYAIPDSVQTDAPINPGNSGGPLVNCQGRVVGVNRAGGGENLGFAISADLVAQVVPALIRTGEYRHPFLGIQPGAVTPALAAANDLNVSEGVYVDEVVEGGPVSDVLQGSTGVAVVNGTRVPVGGDVILAIDGRDVSSPEDLASYLATRTQPGETLRLTIVRDGERRTVNVTLGVRPGEPRT